MRMLKLHDPSMFAAGRGRLASWKWRTAQGVVFATGSSLILDSLFVGFGWLLALCAAMGVDYLLGKQYLAAKTEKERGFYGLLFILGCAATITVFAAMTIWVGVAGGAPGRVFSVLMATSSLVSVMMFLYHAPVFMMITAVPCTACLAVVPFVPYHAGPAGQIEGALGVACGVVAFLVYAGRAAINSGKMFAGLEAANTAAKERQAVAEARQAEAEEANRVKSEFLTTMTHELRTPLNAVIGYSEIIGEDMEAEGHKDLAQDAARITGAARHLLGLIDQILQLTTIDAGKSALELDEVDVRHLLEAAVASVSAAAKTNNNRLATRIAPDVTVAHTDGEKLGICVAHLLANAVKFTSNGLVAVSAERENADGREWLRIAVSDTGIGMTEEQIAKAFQPFTQIDGSQTRAQGGMGLGLSITSRTAGVLGGEVAAVSEPGTGSTFTLRVPMRFEMKMADDEIDIATATIEAAA